MRGAVRNEDFKERTQLTASWEAYLNNKLLQLELGYFYYIVDCQEFGKWNSGKVSRSGH